MIRRRKPIARKGGKDRYGVARVAAAGESYRSGLEVVIHENLKAMEKAGAIAILAREDHVRMHAASFLYIPDFKCLALKTLRFLDRQVERGEEFWVEAKGADTDIWRRNYRLWEYHGPGKLVIYRGSHSRYRLTEVLVPRPEACPGCGRPFDQKGSS